MNISRYFWNLNDKALSETEHILRNPDHPHFPQRIISILSRCDKPKELFAIVPKGKFVSSWPRIRTYWTKLERSSEFRDWWETIYEQLLQEKGLHTKPNLGKSPSLLRNIGRIIRQKRIEHSLSQKDLATMVRMKQPDISRIEEGKKNVTIQTLAKITKILQIKKIDLS